MNFRKGLADLKKVSLTPRQKGEILHRLNAYAEAHQPVKVNAFAALFLKFARVFRAVK